jgi:AcrR family transcriptional regulator
VTDAQRTPVGRESTRARILDAALRLFGKRGFEATTMRDIAEASGVTERTVYRYFPFKEDLVLAEVRELIPVLRDLTAGRPAHERPFTAVHHALKALEEQRPTVIALLLRDVGERLLDRSGPSSPRMVDEFSAGVAAGLLPRLAAASQRAEEGPDPHLAFRAIVLARAAVSPLFSALKATVDLPMEERSPDNVDALLDEAYAALEYG